MDAIRQDLRFALRSLRRAPAVTAMVVGSLALAIAGNTTVFSLVNGILYRPMPYHQPERIVLIGEYQDPRLADNPTGASAANYLDWRERQRSCSELAAYSSDPARLGDDAAGEPVTVGAVTPDFFKLLGNEASQGRTFVADEGKPGNDGVAVLSDSFWRSHFAASTAALGQTVTLNGRPHVVVGVLPPDFEFLDPGVEVWTPLALDPAKVSRQRRDLLVLGRLAPGRTTEEARAEMVAIEHQLAAEYPEADRGYEANVINLREGVPDPRNRQLLALLQGALVFVLLIACSNIANLLLARAQDRTTEIAVRASLGASRRRIVLQLLTESLLLAILGGGVGLGLGILGTRVMGKVFTSQLPRFWLPVVDSRVVVFTVALSLAGGLLFGLLPAVQTARLKVQAALKEGGRGATLGGRRRLISKGLVVAEIALALVLLGGASVLIRSFLRIQHTDPGFETAHLLVLRVTFPAEGSPTAAERAASLDALLERVAAVPGVKAVAASSGPPRSPVLPPQNFTIDAAPPAAGQAPPSAVSLSTSAGFLDALGVRLLKGRFFSSEDRPDSAPVVVINQALAERFWPDRDPVGQRITIRGVSRRIVGVVADVTHGVFLSGESPANLYLPLEQDPPPAMMLTVRTGGQPESVGGPVREAILAADPNLVVSDLQSLDTFVARFFVGMNLFTTILGGFGSLALLLAALGTYGVLAYAVAQRSHEIGIRMAIGARRSQVMGMVTRQGLLLAAIGIALGVPGVLGVTRVIAKAMMDLEAVEPVTIVWVAAVLAVVTLAASWMPARRAAGVDPVVALRME